MNIQKPMNLGDLFSGAAEVFKKLFPRFFVIYLLLGGIPGAFAGAYSKPGLIPQYIMLPFLFLTMFLSVLVFALMFFYILAAIKNVPLTFKQALEETGKAIWPVISSGIMGMLLIFAATAAIMIGTIIITIVLGVLISLFAPKSHAKMLGLLCFIPAMFGFVYAIIRCYFSIHFALMEKTKWFVPFKQSWRLTKGNFGKLFMFMLIFAAYGIIISSLQFGVTPFAYFLIMCALTPAGFFMGILFNLLFFNLYYGNK